MKKKVVDHEYPIHGLSAKATVAVWQDQERGKEKK